MSCFKPSRLTGLGVICAGLTLALVISRGREGGGRESAGSARVSPSMTIPVEIIEVGEAPAIRQIQVRP